MTAVLHLVRRDPRRNLARFYRLEVRLTLFEEWVLVRQWGRIGTEGRRSEVLVGDLAAGHAALLLWSQRKQARGYSIDQP